MKGTVSANWALVPGRRRSDRHKGFVVAIHQPNFFPWLGYFDKMRRADVFVYLDDVDYPRAGSRSMASWCNRVKIVQNGEAKWISAPLRRYSGSRRIREVEIADDQPWRVKLLKTLQSNYGKAPNYEPAMRILEPLILAPAQSIAEFNINAIERLVRLLGVEIRTVRQSRLKAGGTATQRLINITKEVGGTAYLCGGGASSYQDDDLFAEQGIDLIYQNFTPTPYGDPKRFIPGLSVIDFLMTGPTAELDWRA